MNAPDIKEQLVTRAFAIQHSAAPETIRLLLEAAIQQIADLRRQLAEAREVKPLVFRQLVTLGEMEAVSIVGVYRLVGPYWMGPDGQWRKGDIRAAQADYEARILSALKGAAK